jgi:hypothetical protein
MLPQCKANAKRAMIDTMRGIEERLGECFEEGSEDWD